MDFGVLGFDGLVGSEAGFASFSNSDPETKPKWYGSGHLKQERSGITEDDGRSSKLAKTEDVSASKGMLLHQRSTLLRSNSRFFSDDQQPEQMLSFSSVPKSEGLLLRRNSQNVNFPYLPHSSSANSRNTGCNSGSLNGVNMHGVLTGTKGPFTPSQWMELEHQALIYKHMTANVPVPPNLLIPIRKALESAALSGLSGVALRPNTLGWGSFHLGFNNADPEPGRCRRTDGKKWRCSKDAVPDQKYCERHMNRGRHRSRKPVEGQSGHSVTGTTSTSSKLMPTTSSSASVVASGGASNSLATANQQVKNVQSGESNASAATPMKRTLFNKETLGDQVLDTPGLSMLPSSSELKYKESPLMGKQPFPCQQSSQTEFAIVTSDSFVNPSHKSSSLINCRDFVSEDSKTQEVESHSLRHFIDDWPKNQSDRVGVSWPGFDVQSDGTQLSMSIPMASSDFKSSTPSHAKGNNTSSPLRLSRELDPTQMGLVVGSVLNEQNQRQASWIPVSWENSLGGPLGEVLHNTNNGTADCKNSSSADLMTGGRDSSAWLGSSPTGVLQKSSFASLSNSSAGSSPRLENRTHEGANLRNDLFKSTPGNSTSVSAL